MINEKLNLRDIEWNQYQVLKEANRLDKEGHRKMQDHEKVIYNKLHKKFN